MNVLNGMNTMRVKVTLLEEMLAMCPGSETLYTDYQASKIGDSDKVVEEMEDFGFDTDGGVDRKGMTIFPTTEDGEPFIYDYQIRGFFKDSAGLLRKYSSFLSSRIKAYKKAIDGAIFITDRKNVIHLPEGGHIGECQRPLRASTPMGERVAIACSESVPAGSTIEFQVEYLDPSYKDLVIEWLQYGKRHGFGAWRNSGKGTFDFEILD